jgi:hypothetical protein
MTINYDPTVDYGYEVNYLIYNYMIYFQNTFNQKLLVLSRSDNVTIFVIIINKMNKLKQRWGIETIFNSHYLYRFALTGSSAWLSKPFCILPALRKEI